MTSPVFERFTRYFPIVLVKSFSPFRFPVVVVVKDDPTDITNDSYKRGFVIENPITVGISQISCGDTHTVSASARC